MVNVEHFNASLKISWIKKIIKAKAKWQSVTGSDIDILQLIKFGPS